MKVKSIVSRIALYVVLIPLSIIMIAPFVWMISSSLMSNVEIFAFPPKWIPNPPRWSNYLQTVNAMPFLHFTWNSIYISVLSTFGMLLECIIAAYAFARMRFRGKEIIFSVLIACLMIPGQVTMIPVFLIMKEIGWVNTALPLIVPNFFGGAFGIFMLRQFILSLPIDLEEAAIIDGCGRLRIIFQVLLPLLKPAIATLGLFTFMSKWNDLLGPVIYLNDYKKMTLTVGLTMFKGQYQTKYNLLMCGAVITTLPIVIAYVFMQKYFIQGIAMTGIKG